jgi:hypothetical protein
VWVWRCVVWWCGGVVVCGVWCVVCGVWCAVCGVWCVVCGVRCVVAGRWQARGSRPRTQPPPNPCSGRRPRRPAHLVGAAHGGAVLGRVLKVAGPRELGAREAAQDARKDLKHAAGHGALQLAVVLRAEGGWVGSGGVSGVCVCEGVWWCEGRVWAVVRQCRRACAGAGCSLPPAAASSGLQRTSMGAARHDPATQDPWPARRTFSLRAASCSPVRSSSMVASSSVLNWHSRWL